MGATKIEYREYGQRLAHLVAERREAERLTYVDLSKLLAEHGRPIAVLGLRRIERGERRVDADDLVALARVLRFSLADLFPAELIRECPTCHGEPPPSFTCQACGRG